MRQSDSQCSGYGVGTIEPWTSILARGIFASSNITILDFYELFKTRGDLHRNECSHFCYDEDLWTAVMVLLSECE